ncbi:MAG: T9SS type A sorting domain-containing protein [Ignavibacteriaceae bacterium]|nr:T9SS type A sorting domain-containing protein [Ignavibacteriaceae bacterium]
MKILSPFFISFILFSATISPQWTNQNLVPEGNHLWSTFFVDDNTGWIVGSDGFIKKTSNGGIDWIEQVSGTTSTLKSVQFINQNIGWICGETGLVIKTTDGGQNWIELTTGTTELLTDLHFADQNIGYVVGHNETILKTTDGGANWISQSSGSSFDLFSVDFVNTLIGYAVGGKDSSNFLKTTDGGSNWAQKTINLGSLSTPILNCVEFVDANIGYIGSEGQFLNHSGNISKTTDGGETWNSSTLWRPTQIELSEHSAEDNTFDVQRGIRSIYFRDANNGYAVGGTRDGWWRSIFATTDAGATWQKKYGYSEQTGLLSVFVNSSGQGLAVGYSGVIYKTEINESSWSQILSGNNNLYYSGDWITSVFMVNDTVGWAAGYRKGIWYYPIILKTTNGGKIWETNSEFGNSFIISPASIFFLNENIGWVNFYDKSAYKTTDGGETWLPTGNAGNQKLFINQDTGWAVYEPLGVFKSTDGGNNWVQKSSVSSRSIFFSDNNNGWAVGSSGSIIKSIDGGESWFSKSSGTSLKLNSVHFFDNNLGVCAGNSGIVLLTADGGENWITKSTGASANLNTVLFTNACTIWMAGSNGAIINSTDLGNTWTSYSGITEENLFSASFINEYTGWFAGWNGTIIKYLSDITPVELVSFTANVQNNKVTLNWQTATELNNSGYQIERNTVNDNWINLGFVPGYGNSSSPKLYSFVDDNISAGTRFQYRLKQIDNDGKFDYSNIVEVEIFPSNFELFQNYPNPFNPSTTIGFSLPKASQIKINIYNMIGELVETLADGTFEQGYHNISFNAANIPSGTYIYRLESSEFVQIKKMVLIK